MLIPVPHSNYAVVENDSVHVGIVREDVVALCNGPRKLSSERSMEDVRERVARIVLQNITMKHYDSTINIIRYRLAPRTAHGG